MKYTHQEKMDIGKQLYLHEITVSEAMDKYGMGRSTAEKCLTDYKRANGIPVKSRPTKTSKTIASSPDMEMYMSMSKEELINELILAKANELRAKKGYEVKGVGANKEFIPLNSKNSK